MSNEHKKLLRQCSNEALVSIVMPIVQEAINHAAFAVSSDLEIDHSEAKQAIIAQWLKFIGKYPERALNADYLSIWTMYHPADDYEQAPGISDDNEDDISPDGNIAA